MSTATRVFELQSRVGVDACAVDAKELQNRSTQNYRLFNMYPTNQVPCEAQESELNAFAADNYVQFKDGYGFANPCRVDNDSEMRNGSKLTNERYKNQLFPRVFQAVPSLTHSGLNAGVESRLIHGEITNVAMPCGVLSEVSIDRFTPMVPCLKSTVQDPRHIVPDWTWGGEPTRDTTVSEPYLKEQGYQFDGKVWRRGMCGRPAR